MWFLGCDAAGREAGAEKRKGLHAFACNPSILLLNLGAADRNRTSDLRITDEKFNVYRFVLEHIGKRKNPYISVAYRIFSQALC
jgi:hypothetical protein